MTLPIFCQNDLRGYRRSLSRVHEPVFTEVFDNLKIELKADQAYRTFVVTVMSCTIHPTCAEENILAQFKVVTSRSMHDELKDQSAASHFRFIYALLQGAPSQIGIPQRNVAHSDKFPYTVGIDPKADFGLCFFMLKPKGNDPRESVCIPTYYLREGFSEYQGRQIGFRTEPYIILTPHCVIFCQDGAEYIFQFNYMIGWEDLCAIITCEVAQEIKVLNRIIINSQTEGEQRYEASKIPPPSVNPRKDLQLIDLGDAPGICRGTIKFLVDYEDEFLFNVSNCTLDVVLSKCTEALEALNISKITLKAQNKILRLLQRHSDVNSSANLIQLLTIHTHVNAMLRHVRALG